MKMEIVQRARMRVKGDELFEPTWYATKVKVNGDYTLTFPRPLSQEDCDRYNRDAERMVTAVNTNYRAPRRWRGSKVK